MAKKARLLYKARCLFSRVRKNYKRGLKVKSHKLTVEEMEDLHGNTGKCSD